MALTLVTTVGASSANSYVTKAEADTYAESVFPASTVDAWTHGATEDQIRALVRATELLDQMRSAGDRVDATQKLAWPRAGVTKPDGSSAYLSTEIPELIKRAQARLAFFLLQHATDPDVFGPSEDAGLSSIGFGSELSMAFEAGSPRQSEGQRFIAEVIRPILGDLVYAPSARLVRG